LSAPAPARSAYCNWPLLLVRGVWTECI
jgi:hypothetical protein